MPTWLVCLRVGCSKYCHVNEPFLSPPSCPTFRWFHRGSRNSPGAVAAKQSATVIQCCDGVAVSGSLRDEPQGRSHTLLNPHRVLPACPALYATHPAVSEEDVTHCACHVEAVEASKNGTPISSADALHQAPSTGGSMGV